VGTVPLQIVIELLRQIVHGTERDPRAQMADLQRRRDEIHREIAAVSQGELALLDPTALREHYQRVASTARELLSDFREVEQNFRSLDRAARERAALLGEPAGPAGFLSGLGLAAKPEMIRLRADPALSASLSLSDITAPVEDLRALEIRPRTAVIVENEITFLSVPVPTGGVVLWDKGFEVDRAGPLPWLRDAEVHHWGDLDTDGFAILNRLRAWLPRARSFLMDRETLVAHRDRWVTEGSPTRAHSDTLTPAEADLYEDLVTDRLGQRVRLEQERIDWTWAAARFPPRRPHRPSCTYCI